MDSAFHSAIEVEMERGQALGGEPIAVLGLNYAYTSPAGDRALDLHQAASSPSYWCPRYVDNPRTE